MTTITHPGQRDGGGDVPRVVVAGAGFGGLAAMRPLARAGMRTTLIDRNVYSTFQPLLYQLATGGLSGSDVAGQAGAADPVQLRRDPVAQDDGIVAGVQAQAVLGCPGNPVVGGADAGGQDEVVVPEGGAVGQQDLPRRGVEAG